MLSLSSSASPLARARALQPQKWHVKIHQRGVQWKQGVVICMMLCTSLLYDTTSIHCTLLPLHDPVMNTQKWHVAGSTPNLPTNIIPTKIA